MGMRRATWTAKRAIRALRSPYMILTLISLATLILSVNATVALAAEGSAPSTPEGDAQWRGTAMIGAGLAIAGSCIGAGIGILGAASSGLAAMVEKPELAVWVLILAGLAEGIAIYGLLIAIMILGKV